MRFSNFISTPNIGIQQDMEVGYDSKVFQKMVNFVTTIKPEQLDNNQLNNIVDIIKDFNMGVKGTVESNENTQNEMCKKNLDKILVYYNENKDILDKQIDSKINLSHLYL